MDIDSFLKMRAAGVPVLDVRSPGEFARGHMPGAWNVPLLHDGERAVVGTLYARRGYEAAFQEAKRLVTPQIAEKTALAHELCPQGRALAYCWRGGQRSAAMVELLTRAGLEVRRLDGGYRAYRAKVRQDLGRPAKVLVLSGMTGCGKTDMLQALARRGHQVVDLEALAGHRGSAFGGVGLPPQPGNETVENALHAQWMRLDFTKVIWVEDESRRIGTVTLCEEFFAHLEKGTLVVVELPVELRIQRLVSLYAPEGRREDLRRCLDHLVRRLGTEIHARCGAAIAAGDYASAVRLVLGYYDKAYAHQIQRRASQVAQVVRLETDKPERAADLLEALEAARGSR